MVLKREFNRIIFIVIRIDNNISTNPDLRLFVKSLRGYEDVNEARSEADRLNEINGNIAIYKVDRLKINF